MKRLEGGGSPVVDSGTSSGCCVLTQIRSGPGSGLSLYPPPLDTGV